MVYYDPPYNRVGWHPLYTFYTLNNQVIFIAQMDTKGHYMSV